MCHILWRKKEVKAKMNWNREALEGIADSETFNIQRQAGLVSSRKNQAFVGQAKGKYQKLILHREIDRVKSGP